MFAGITAVVIGGTPLSGGRGGVVQSAIGVVILSVLANGMIFVGISPYIQKSVQGGIILCAMLIATWHLRSRLRVVK
jgi:ribose transport system permease protein